MIGIYSKVTRSVSLCRFPWVTYSDTLLGTFTHRISLFYTINVMQLIIIYKQTLNISTVRL